MIPGIVILLATLQAPSTDTLSLAAALERARTVRQSVQIAGARIGQARAELRFAGAIPNPLGRYEYSEDPPTRHARIEQSFDWLLSRSAGRSAARWQLRAAGFDSLQAMADLAEEVRLAYFGAVASRATADLAVRQARLADSLVIIARRRFAAGDIAQLELDRTALEAARARLAVSLARENRAAADAELRRALAWPEQAEPPTLTGALDEELDQAPDTTDLPAGPLLRAAEADSAAAMARVALARRAWIPLPTVEAGTDWADPTQPGKTLAAVAFSFPLPLFHQGGADIARARAQAAESAGLLQELRLALSAQARSARARLLESARRARLARDSLGPAASDLRARSVRAYDAGQTGILPVLDALQTEHDTGAQVIEALLAYQEALAAWNRLVGLDR